MIIEGDGRNGRPLRCAIWMCRPGLGAESHRRAILGFGLHMPDTEPPKPEFTHSANRTQHRAPSFPRDVARQRNAHTEKMAVRMLMTDESKRNECQVSVLERRAVRIVTAQYGTDCVRQIVTATDERLAPALYQSGHTAQIKMAIGACLAYELQYDEMRAED